VAEYDGRRQQEAVERALTELRQRVSTLTYRAFCMHWIEGQTIKQIAAELNLTSHKLSCRIYQAKLELRFLCSRVEH